MAIMMQIANLALTDPEGELFFSARPYKQAIFQAYGYPDSYI